MFNISVSLLHSLFPFCSVISFSSSVTRSCLFFEWFFLTSVLSFLTFFSLDYQCYNTTHKCNMGLQPLIPLFRMILGSDAEVLKFPMLSLTIVTLISIYFHVFQVLSNLHQSGISWKSNETNNLPTFSIFRSLSTRHWDIRFKIRSTKESESRGGIRKIETQAWWLQSSHRMHLGASRNEIGNATRNVVLSRESAYCESESRSRWTRYISHGTSNRHRA